MHQLAALNRPLRLVLWCALVAGIGLMSLGVRQVDLWWQLPEGLSILQTHHLPTEPPAAFGLPAHPFIDEYGLYEIGLGALYRLGGLAAIHVAFIATYLLIFLAPLTTARGVRRDIISMALLGLAGIFMVNRFEQRPEIAGVLLFSLLLVLMRRARGFGPRFLLRIGLLMTIWTNVHSSYLIGLLALFLWLIDRVFLCEPRLSWSRMHAVLTLAVAGACVLINPYGWRRIAFTFEQEHDLGSNLLSREMWPAWDQPPLVQVLMFVTAALLVLAILTRKRPPLWLVILGVVAFLLTLFNIRQMSFLAVTLLYLYAEWRPEDPSPRWQPVRTLVLVAGCVAMLLFDFIAARGAIHDLFLSGNEPSRAFTSESSLHHAAVLCHDAEGSYIGFGNPGLFPLLDSGQGRFNDDTKRFYFFVVQTPHGFDLALDQLRAVDDLVVTAPVGGWALAMVHRPGWRLAHIDPTGLCFQRMSPTPGPLDPSQIAQLAKLRDQASSDDDPVRATCFSALIDEPSVSLALLDRSRASAWSEAFFSFTRAWIQKLPKPELAHFLIIHSHPDNPLLRELLLAGLPPDQPLPTPGPSAIERLARVLTLLGRGDPSGARTIFASIRRPMVSPLYYTLRDRLNPESAQSATAPERWQDWNAGGQALFERVSPQLNERAKARVQFIRIE